MDVPSTEAPVLASRLTRIDIIAGAWVAFAAVPALVFAVAHYGWRLARASMAFLRPRR